MTLPQPSKRRAGLWGAIRAFTNSLAGRLLGLTAVIVLAIEICVFLPALARFHEDWIRERINQAQIAALALEPGNDIADALEDQLLTNAEVQHVALQREGERVLLLGDPNAGPPAVPPVTYDYTTASATQRFMWAYDTFFAPPARILRVLAKPRFEAGDFIEIVLREAALKRAMEAYAWNFLWASTLILVAVATLIYGMLTVAFVRPMRELTEAIERFRDKPEDVSIAFPRSRSADEIGRAQRAAADMAEQVRNSMRQKDRLAALGAAVARIGHDLRNMLSTAQMVADRLSKSEDPEVQRQAQRLERTIARASGLAAGTLKYGRADEKAPELHRLDVAPAVEDAADDGLVGFDDIAYRPEIEAGLACIADPEHFHRIVTNLVRNAAQAMRQDAIGSKEVIVRAARFETRCEIEIIDHGTGVRENLRERLFEPFVSAAPEAGGTGLGLAIARELTRAMGGELELTRTGAEGSTFKITLPAA
ncbi:MAG: HAMP domain-containing histidine kinase [Proteobacteria bacterium]|nr:HAMP domain-containing histidine kinase [Pseudomonadota bacterium]